MLNVILYFLVEKLFLIVQTYRIFTTSYFKFHKILYERIANEDDAVGRVLGYTIIVTEDYTKNTEGDAFLPGWRDVQKFSVWPPYQVSHKFFHLCVDDLVWTWIRPFSK